MMIGGNPKMAALGADMQKQLEADNVVCVHGY